MDSEINNDVNNSTNFIDSIVNEFKNMDYKDVIYLIVLIILSGVVIILPKKIKHNGYDILRIFRTLGVRLIMFIGIIACGLKYDIFITSILGIMCFILTWICYGIGNNINTNNIINTTDKFHQLMNILIENNEDDENNIKDKNIKHKMKKQINKSNISINNDEDSDDEKSNESYDKVKTKQSPILNILSQGVLPSINKNNIKNISKKIKRLSNIMYSDNNTNDNEEETQPLLRKSNLYTNNLLSINNNDNNKLTENNKKESNNNLSDNTINNDINDINNIIENNDNLKYIKNKINNTNNDISLNISKKISDYNKINKNKHKKLINNKKLILNKMKDLGIENFNEFNDDLYDYNLSDNEIINSSSSDDEKENYNKKKSNLRKSDTFLNETLKPYFIKYMLDECNKNNNNEKFINYIKNKL